MQYSYIVVSDNEASVKEMLLLMEDFPDYYCAGSATTKESALNTILELRPQLVFLEFTSKTKSDLSLAVITDLHQYINVLPHFIVSADTEKLALDAIRAGVLYYLLRPMLHSELRKSLFKFQKAISLSHSRHIIPLAETVAEDTLSEDKSANEVQKSEVDIQICIKSYGDYQFIALKDVVYLEADNNTTDFYLLNGKKLSAYKTLKHYENNLPSFFYRIHNSYIVNSNHVSRINTGKQLCYLNNNEVSVSFSKTFKDNIDTIIRKIAPEYL